ncbi:MAG: phosphopantothenoylcysteine decarboxylase [Phycisphaerales bacterium]
MPTARSPRRATPARSKVRTRAAPGHLLITAGPTHEPIDAVRFIGNRSSGQLGIALADAAAKAGWHVTLLLGPTNLTPSDPKIRVLRFRTTTDLQALLTANFHRCDALVMAAAVADYRPATSEAAADADGKLRRVAEGLTLRLEPTPDLLAQIGRLRQPGQVLVGFALEPRSRMMASAQDKLTRKGLDLIVANPLETMDAPTIEATVIGRAGVVLQTPKPVAKARFATQLAKLVAAHVAESKRR